MTWKNNLVTCSWDYFQDYLDTFRQSFKIGGEIKVHCSVTPRILLARYYFITVKPNWIIKLHKNTTQWSTRLQTQTSQPRVQHTKHWYPTLSPTCLFWVIIQILGLIISQSTILITLLVRGCDEHYIILLNIILTDL